jgi:nucleoside-triphosphatase THEP1
MADDADFAIHLICGSTGAGKTTYANRLAEEVGGVVFSIDQNGGGGCTSAMPSRARRISFASP